MVKFLGKNKFENPQIVHVVKKGETLESIKKIYGQSAQILGTPKFYDGECILIENLNKNFYVVKPTDTLKKICKKLKVQEQELRQKNKITKLFVGQILWH